MHLKTTLPSVGHGRTVQEGHQRPILENRQWVLLITVQRDQSHASSQPYKPSKFQATFKDNFLKSRLTWYLDRQWLDQCITAEDNPTEQEVTLFDGYFTEGQLQ